jgi:hypothetical protein
LNPQEKKINFIEEPSKTKAKSLVKPQTVEKTNQVPLRNLPSGALLI